MNTENNKHPNQTNQTNQPSTTPIQYKLKQKQKKNLVS